MRPISMQEMPVSPPVAPPLLARLDPGVTGGIEEVHAVSPQLLRALPEPIGDHERGFLGPRRSGDGPWRGGGP